MSNRIGGVEVADSWIRVFKFCNTKFRYGDITLRIVDGQPIHLVSAKAHIRWDKPQTIPTEWELSIEPMVEDATG